ncbi:MAG: MFS transporter [Patescibacteria group bacterium]
MSSPTSFLLKKTNIKTGKQLLFHLTAMMWVFSYSLLAFSVSLILSEKLSVFFVGLFMSITGLIAIFADVPMGYIQKIIPSRWLLFFSILGLMFATFIFLASKIAIIIIFLAVLIYGLTHDLYDITMLSYIFQNSHPEQYSQNISQKNVAEALGLVLGLGMTSAFGIIRNLFDPLWITLIFLLVTAIFILLFFNKTEYDVEISELDTKVIANKFSAQELIDGLENFMISSKNVAIDKIHAAQEAIKEKIGNKQVVMLKPIRPLQTFEKEGFIKELKDSFAGLGSIFSPPKAPLIWSSIVVAFFSFWDTFVITFQPIFILKEVIIPAKLSPAYTGLIIGIFIIPLFLCQVPFSKLSEKIGRPFFMYLGLGLAAASIFGFSISHDVFWVILMGLGNSIGYAAAFPTAQSFFAERFQENYALIHNTQTIDANVSAGPLKMIINSGNVFGTFIGGVIISVFSFDVAFISISAFLAVTFLVSLLGIAWVTKSIKKEEPPASEPQKS